MKRSRGGHFGFKGRSLVFSSSKQSRTTSAPSFASMTTSRWRASDALYREKIALPFGSSAGIAAFRAPRRRARVVRSSCKVEKGADALERLIVTLWKSLIKTRWSNFFFSLPRVSAAGIGSLHSTRYRYPASVLAPPHVLSSMSIINQCHSIAFVIS